MSRGRRWLIRLLIAACVFAVLVWVGLKLVLPPVIQHQVSAALRAAGLEDVKFDLTSTSPWHTTVSKLTAGKDDWLSVGNVTIEYSPAEAIRGEIRTIRVHNARLVISLENLSEMNSDSSGSFGGEPIPVSSIGLESCTLVLKRGESRVEFPLDGTLLRTPSGASQLNIRAMVEQSPITASGLIDPAKGKADVTAYASGVRLAAMQGLLPLETQKNIARLDGTLDIKVDHHRGGATTLPDTSLSLELNDAGAVGKGDFEGELRGTFAKVRIDRIVPLSIPAGQWLTASSLKISGQELTGVRVVFDAPSPNAVHIADAQLSWAGGRFKLAPFEYPLVSGAIESTVSAEHVDLAQVLALITSGRATGSGRIAGQVPVTFDGSHFRFGDGKLTSEGPGALRLGSMSDQLATVLDRTDPRFSTEAAMQNVKQQILAALTDFEYDSLVANFKRETEKLVVSLRIVGKGRTNAKQPFDITLNFSGVEEALNTYLQTRKRVLNLAR